VVPFPIVENLTYQFMEDKSDEFGTSVSWSKLKEAAETREGIEGWIIQANDGQMWKVKTAWYCRLHHSVTFTRYRDVARAVLADESDDLKGAFAMTGRSIEPIIEIERKINRELRIVQDAVELHVMNGRALERTAKDMALALKEHELFGLIMTEFRGKTVNYREHYLKNHIKDWSLEVIPTGAQNEDIELPVSVEEEA